MTHLPMTPLLQDYAKISASLPGVHDSRVATLRAMAAESYRTQGLPHARVEAWRYTRLKDLETLPFSCAAALSDVSEPVEGAGLAGAVLRIVLVNGQYVESLSSQVDIPGLAVGCLREALDAGDDAVIQALDGGGADFAGAPLAALATAYMDDGVVVRVAEGVSVAPLVEVVALATVDVMPHLAFPRFLLLLGAGAEMTLVETFTGPAKGVYAVNAVTDLCMGEGARLNHYVLQAQGAEATHVSLGRCAVPAKAHYEGFVLQLGAKTARHEMRLKMQGVGGEAKLHGAYAVRGEATCDTTTVVDHIAEETITDQVFKGILDDKSHGIYQGRVHVHRNAQRINGNQLHKALLLSRSARVDCKPELEIYADDVKCSHGATVGELDDDQVFYLQARGIDVVTARALLLRAFLGEALDMISVDAVRTAFGAHATGWLDNARGVTS
ncbi:MAG: Fe-S cluster assembly protein SufD [Rhodospirillaceae bacterium]|nr:Fe-S cluster assembly protein SufD [Rhodospirillaceae bacterium]